MGDESPFVEAILAEIADRLAVLAETGEGHAIDLRSLPMTPDDRTALEAALGKGEASARLEVGGATTADETAFSGVWHIRHFDPEGRVLREILEIAFVPELLPAHPADVANAAMALRDSLIPSPAEKEIPADA